MCKLQRIAQNLTKALYAKFVSDLHVLMELLLVIRRLRVGNILSYHEIFSQVILFLPLIQEGQLSVSGKRMCTIRLTA